jgi:hypothetical protein
MTLVRDLPEILRRHATYDLGTNDSLRHDLRMAADALESYEAAERERLEHESVAPEDFDALGLAPELAGLPPIPMRESYSPCDLGLLAYNVDMVAWVRAVTGRADA